MTFVAITTYEMRDMTPREEVVGLIWQLRNGSQNTDWAWHRII